MKSNIGIVLVALIGFGLIDLAPAKDIVSDHLLSLVRSYNQLENKLERHEYRERALGELIKKALQSLQIGQRSMEPMKGIFSRLDERVSQIETLLMAQEQKYNQQTEKIDEVIKLIKWLDETSNKKVDTIKEPVVVEAPINGELIKEIRDLSANIEKLLSASGILAQKTDAMIEKAPRTEELIYKLENKLVSLHTAPVTTTAAPIVIDNSEFENKVMESFKNITANIDELKTAPASPVQQYTGLLPADKEFLQALTNETLSALDRQKQETSEAADKGLTKTSELIKEYEANINNTLLKLSADATNTTEGLERFFNEMNISSSALNDGLSVFNKILTSNSDEILKTQRKVEFGSHQILQKVNDIIESQQLELSQALMKRFDDLDEAVSNNHMETLTNISSSIESEISLVWRQIEIMHSEMTDSKDALAKLHGQTEVYVNGTITTMDGMEGKVSQITSRMLEVDSNLNYLLGRLSLITQEFNQIKTGLGEALDQIRGSFHEVRDKIMTQGPGPHNIPKNEYETDFNLLTKRNVA